MRDCKAAPLRVTDRLGPQKFHATIFPSHARITTSCYDLPWSRSYHDSLLRPAVLGLSRAVPSIPTIPTSNRNPFSRVHDAEFISRAEYAPRTPVARPRTADPAPQHLPRLFRGGGTAGERVLAADAHPGGGCAYGEGEEGVECSVG